MGERESNPGQVAEGQAIDASQLPQCDLIMKGGIASGIVYPTAIAELSKKYRFASIGGTSAGAIAAALTAAAEYGRQRNPTARPMNGLHPCFSRLVEVGKALSEPGEILKRFKPDRRTAALLEVIRKAAAQGPLLLRMARVYGTLWRWATGPTLVGTILGIGLWILFAWLQTYALSPPGSSWRETLNLSLFSPAGVIPFIIFALLGGAIGGLWAILRIVSRTLPNQTEFGICFGHEPGAHASEDGVLTDWLTWAIQYVAFGEEESELLNFSRLQEEGIELAMMTTNVSRERPYRLPLETDEYVFAEEDMNRLFPREVVVAMASANRTPPVRSLPDGWHPLPSEELPVVVAARMSLSFPLLISAVRLYSFPAFRGNTKDGSSVPIKRPREELSISLFSDGGISSNFPIHFFDNWIPSRPTFGIQLVDVQPRQVSQEEGPSEVIRPFMHRADAHIAELSKPIRSTLGFLGAIFSSAQNFRDTMQSRLPGYRERIVFLPLRPKEGGLNLDMPKEMVDELLDRGELAGKAFLGFDFEQHRWVRFLVLMSNMEANLKPTFHDRNTGDADLSTLLTRSADSVLYPQGDKRRYPYAMDAGWIADSGKVLRELQRSASLWPGPAHFVPVEPKPPTVMRVTPKE